MVSYKKLGLVNTKKMFAKAVKGGYAIPAFNFNTMEQMQAIVQAAVETKSPVIMQVSKGARKYANPTILRYMAEGAVQYAKELGCKKPQIVLHLDHGLDDGLHLLHRVEIERWDGITALHRLGEHLLRVDKTEFLVADHLWFTP